MEELAKDAALLTLIRHALSTSSSLSLAALFLQAFERGHKSRALYLLVETDAESKKS